MIYLIYFTIYIILKTSLSYCIKKRPFWATGGIVSDTSRIYDLGTTDTFQGFCGGGLNEFEKVLISPENIRNLERVEKAGRELGVAFRKFNKSIKNTEKGFLEFKTAIEKGYDGKNNTY